MLKITVNPIVLQTLEAKFPKKNSAKRALDKYVMLLEQQFTQSVAYGRSEWMAKKGMFSISIYRQRNRGGQIGPNKIRLQNWLEDNDLELFSVSELGTNITKKLSVVQLTALATVTSIVTVFKTKEEIETEEVRQILDNQAITNQQFFEQQYPELSMLTEREVHERFDIVPIDMQSLRNYLHWLQYDSSFLSPEKFEQYKTQADRILRIAQFTDGIYLQRRKQSDFGRHYYSGTSVQNVNKELRRAMLGHCWEYDIRGAVFAWKMGYARSLYESIETDESFEKTFAMTLNYLNDKKDFMMTIRHYTYPNDSNVPIEIQDKSIKQAITAISFGARRGTTGWRVNGSEIKNPAIVEIFKNMEVRERFMKCPIVKQFITEQNALDKFIFSLCRASNPPFLTMAEVRTPCGMLSKSKVLAYLYQHIETQVMDVVVEEVEKRGRKVLARIHDAIIIDKRLGADTKQEIEVVMQRATSNPHWRLSAKELQPYERPYSLDKAEIDAHHQRINAETQIAVEKKSKGLLKTFFNWVG